MDQSKLQIVDKHPSISAKNSALIKYFINAEFCDAFNASLIKS